MLKTTLDVATAPIAIVKDVATLGGTITGDDFAIVKKARQLADDGEEIREECDGL